MLLCFSFVLLFLGFSQGNNVRYTQLSTNYIEAVENSRVRIPCSFEIIHSYTFLLHRFIGNNHSQDVSVGSRLLWSQIELELNKNIGRYDLILQKADVKRHSGLFECIWLEYGKVFHRDTFVTILPAPTGLQMWPHSIVVNNSGALVVFCNTTKIFDGCAISWFKIQHGEKTKITTDYPSNKCSSSIGLTLEKSDNNAIIQCEMYDRYQDGGTRNVTSVPVIVKYPPIVKIGPAKTYSVKVGHKAKINCSVDSNPVADKIQIRFRKNIVSNKTSYAFRVDSPKLAGFYTCSAQNALGKSVEDALVLDVQYFPVISLPFAVRKIKEHRDLKVKCQVTANPPPENIHWLSERDPNFKSVGPHLLLTNVTRKDAGEFTCVARNRLRTLTLNGTLNERQGTRRLSFTLLVMHPPGVSTIVPQNFYGVEGETAVFECRINVYPPPTFTWQMEGFSKVLGTGKKLTVQLNRNLEGVLLCQPENELGYGEVSHANITLTDGPKITRPFLDSELIANLGATNFSLECQASSKPRSNVSWYWGRGNIIDQNFFKGAFTIETNQSVSTSGMFLTKSRLHFPKILAPFRGYYGCEFNNGKRSVTSSGFLEVPATPQIVNREQTLLTASIGEKATLECRVFSTKPATLEWTRNSNAVQETTSWSKLGDYYSSLVIKNVQEKDFGAYQCISNNEEGTAILNITLEKDGTPKPPKNVAILLEKPDSFFVTWDFEPNPHTVMHKILYRKLADLGNLEVDSKFVNCGTSVPCKVDNLEQNEEYDITVVPYNDIGIGQGTSTIARTAADPEIEASTASSVDSAQTDELQMIDITTPFPVSSQEHLGADPNNGSHDALENNVDAPQFYATVDELEVKDEVQVRACNPVKIDCVQVVTTVDPEVDAVSVQGPVEIHWLSLLMMLLVFGLVIFGAACLVVAYGFPQLASSVMAGLGHFMVEIRQLTQNLWAFSTGNIPDCAQESESSDDDDDDEDETYWRAFKTQVFKGIQGRSLAGYLSTPSTADESGYEELLPVPSTSHQARSHPGFSLKTSYV